MFLLANHSNPSTDEVEVYSLPSNSSPTTTCSPIPLDPVSFKKLFGMWRTPLDHILIHLNSRLVPVGAHLHRVPFRGSAGLTSNAAQVYVFVDAAAESVCGDSCATHDKCWMRRLCCWLCANGRMQMDRGITGLALVDSVLL